MNFMVDNAPIIGQYTLQTFAALRAPAFLPESLTTALFETHTLYMAILAIAAAAALFVGVTRANKPAKLGGIAGLALAALWLLLALTFVTPRERLYAAHSQIIAAAQANDPAPIKSLLHPDFSYGPNNRTTMNLLVDAAMKAFKIKSATVRFFDIQPTLDPQARQTHINVLVQLDAAGTSPAPGGTYVTKWTLQWVDVPNQDWQLRQIVNARLAAGEQEMEIPNNLGIQ